MVYLCVLAYDKGQLNVVKLAQQRYSPCGSAFGAWRQIARLSCPRVTESHRNNGDYPTRPYPINQNSEPILWSRSIVHPLDFDVRHSTYLDLWSRTALSLTVERLFLLFPSLNSVIF